MRCRQPKKKNFQVEKRSNKYFFSKHWTPLVLVPRKNSGIFPKNFVAKNCYTSCQNKSATRYIPSRWVIRSSSCPENGRILALFPVCIMLTPEGYFSDPKISLLSGGFCCPAGDFLGPWNPHLAITHFTNWPSLKTSLFPPRSPRKIRMLKTYLIERGHLTTWK